jgi:arabinogalactan oligomer/maltooligosaccharide transport system substrate-binding protein
MKIRKSGVAAAVATLAVASLIGVSTPAIADTPTLTVWYPSDKKATYSEAVAAWAKDNGVTVTMVGKDFGQVRDQLKTAVPAGTGPDILLGAAHDWTGNLIAAGVVRPINLAASVAGGLTPASLALFNVNGKQYGVPAYTENLAFLRNVAKAPSKVAKLSDIKNGELQIGYSGTNGDPYHFYPLQTAFGAPVFDRTSRGWAQSVAMDGANGAAFAKFLTKGEAFFGKANNWGNLACDFINGKKKYWITGPWAIKDITGGNSACKTGLKYGKFAIDSFPAGPTGIKGVQFLGGKGMFLTNSPSTDVVRSTQLLSYLAGKDAQVSFFNAEYAAPANKAALAVASNDPVIGAFAAAGKNAVPMPAFVSMDSVFDKWGKTEAKIIVGKSTNPSADWTALNDAITALFKG